MGVKPFLALITMKTFIFQYGNLLVVVAEETEEAAEKIAKKLAQDRHANTAQPFPGHSRFVVELPKGGTFAKWV